MRVGLVHRSHTALRSTRIYADRSIPSSRQPAEVEAGPSMARRACPPFAHRLSLARRAFGWPVALVVAR